MRDDLGWAVWSRERQQRIEHVLAGVLPPVEGPTARLADAMRYATLGGGKRVRPLLAYAAGEFAHADPALVDAAAAAVELIHAYSLIHDDLPCMDDDDAASRQADVPRRLWRGDRLACRRCVAGAGLRRVRRLFVSQRRRSVRDIGRGRGRSRYGGRPGDRPRCRRACAPAARARGDAPDEDRRADTRGRAAWRGLRRRSRRRANAARSMRMPPRRGSRSRWSTTCSTSRARTRRSARRPARTPLGTSQRTWRCSDSTKRSGMRPRSAPRRTPRYPPFAVRGRRLIELADWITLRKH